MIRISNSSIFKFGSIFLFSFFLFSHSTFAQNEDENVFLPPAPGTTASEEETNVYLQRDSAPAQNTQTETASNSPAAGTRLSCPYVFTRDLELGMSGEDVRLLQTILNKDSSTAIATSGAGSAGKETGTYGESTKSAVAKLQEKAKEYIGTINGRFGPRTRTVVNQICSASTANGGGFNKIIPVQNQNTESEVGTDKVAPRVSLSANFNSIQTGNTFKIIVNLSEPIKAFTPDFVIVDNGEVKEIRKLSKNSYVMTVVPNEGAKSVNVQIEAERIEDMAGNLNENASNEVLVKILIPQPTPNPNGPVVKDGVDSLIDKITSSTPDCKYDNSGDLITKNPITGEKLNANGCKMKDPSKQFAPFNTVLKCYADTGELPPGIQETQRCSNPQNPNSPNNPLNPNNPNSPCSPFNQQQYANQVLQIQRQSSAGGFSFGTVLPPNPCQNAQVVQATQQKMQQQRQQAQQAAQQQAQFQGLGQMLGNLLKGGAFGGGPGQNNSRNDGPDQRYQPPADEKDNSDKDKKDTEQTTDENKNKDFSKLTIYGKNCTKNKEGEETCTDTPSTELKPCSAYDSMAAILKPNCIPDNKDGKTNPEKDDVTDKGGVVAEDPKTSKLNCPYVIDTKKGEYKTTGLVLKIKTTSGKYFVLYQKATGWGTLGNSNISPSKIENQMPYVEKTDNITETPEYKCCRSKYYTTRCDQPDGPLDNLETKEIKYSLTKKEEISIGSDKNAK